MGWLCRWLSYSLLVIRKKSLKNLQNLTKIRSAIQYLILGFFIFISGNIFLWFFSFYLLLTIFAPSATQKWAKHFDFTFSLIVVFPAFLNFYCVALLGFSPRPPDGFIVKMGCKLHHTSVSVSLTSNCVFAVFPSCVGSLKWTTDVFCLISLAYCTPNTLI